MSNLVPLGGIGRRQVREWECPEHGCGETETSRSAVAPECPRHGIPMRKAK